MIRTRPRRSRYRLAGVVAAGLLLVAASAPASAEFNNPEWSGPNGAPLTGSWMASSPKCAGERSGGFVRAVQAFLWAMHHYGRPSGNEHQVDGVWGGATRSAAMSYQRASSLHADGCIGSRSWQSLEERRIFIGAVRDGYYSRFRVMDLSHPEFITVDLSPFCWWTEWGGRWWIWASYDDTRCPIVNFEFDPPVVEGYEHHP